MDNINSTYNSYYAYYDYLSLNESIYYDNEDYEVNFANCTNCHCPEDIYIYYIDGIFLLNVALFGIIGTIMSMIVLLKPRIRDFFSYFLIALSVFDCSFLILAIIYIGLPAVSCQ